MKSVRIPVILCALMISFAVAALALRPSQSRRADSPQVVLGKLIPSAFGSWRTVETGTVQVVNPQLQKTLDKLYSQQLTRTYASTEGYVVMLSIAYGEDQRNGLQVHLPEVCYPAQGFAITDRSRGTISSADVSMTVTRMEARMGARVEPVTYWITLGEQSFAALSNFQRRMAELRYAFSGEVPDGLLFRVSSIDQQREHAFRQHERFVSDLLAALGPTDRAHLVGAPRR